MTRRNTIQKEIVLKTVRALHGHVTADEIYAEIIKEYPSMGRGTVYRNLNILAEEGLIRKVDIPDGPSRFDFTTEDHYHVVCVKCGKVMDVDMDLLPDLLTKIKDPQGIKYLGYDILFKGSCKACQSENF